MKRVEKDIGLKFDVISSEEEAHLSVLGCASLLEPEADVALIVDIGGGSTEFSWVSPKDVIADPLNAPILSWGTAPLGVVTLAEEESEPDTGRDVWFDGLVTRLAESLESVGNVQHLRQPFLDGRAHVIGTSGTVTSLAGVHLQLPRYQRSRVDGYWFDVADCRAVITRMLHQTLDERAANPCVGKDRADLVVLGGAILDAVLRVWPTPRIRVADRGLREGVLMRLIAKHRGRA